MIAYFDDLVDQLIDDVTRATQVRGFAGDANRPTTDWSAHEETDEPLIADHRNFYKGKSGRGTAPRSSACLMPATASIRRGVYSKLKPSAGCRSHHTVTVALCVPGFTRGEETMALLSVFDSGRQCFNNGDSGGAVGCFCRDLPVGMVHSSCVSCTELNCAPDVGHLPYHRFDIFRQCPTRAT